MPDGVMFDACSDAMPMSNTLPATLGARLRRPGKARPVARAVTHNTSGDMPREIFAARDLLWRGGNLTVEGVDAFGSARKRYREAR